MDSRIVNREIRTCVWPKLKSVGFTTYTSRTAWRYSGEQIDVLNFQSYNRYNSDILGITPFSFSVNLGCYLIYLPPRYPARVKNSQLVPSEAQCEFRSRLIPTIPQHLNSSEKIWSIDKEGLNLASCIGDVQQQLPIALDWYKKFSDKRNVLKILLETDETPDLWGFGSNPSPIRSYLAGYASLSLGEQQLAHKKLAEAVKSGCFTHLFTGVTGAINRAV